MAITTNEHTVIRLIVAMDFARGIARAGHQPWKLPADEQYFARQTKLHGGIVLMGSTTFKVIGRPLPERTNYVLTSGREATAGVRLVRNLDTFLQEQADVWVVGGASVYAATINKADELYVTQIYDTYGCDQFFPDIPDGFELVSTAPHTDGNTEFEYQRFVRIVKNVASVMA